MKIYKKISVFFVVFLIPLIAKNAWALYKQPLAVTIVDQALPYVFAALTLYIFIRVKFDSSRGFWISTGIVIINLLIFISTYGCVLHIVKSYDAIVGWDRLGIFDDTEILADVLDYQYTVLIPLSVFFISLLSRKKIQMTLCLLGIIAGFCAIEIGLNYYEINGYLSRIEKSDYQDFKDGLAIRNYLSQSGMSNLRLYPRARTKKVLLAELKNKSWACRHDAALSLQYLKDPSTIPYLLECMRIEDATVTPDYARIQCAITLEMLLSNNYDYSVDIAVGKEHEKNPKELFDRIEKKAAKYKAL